MVVVERCSSEKAIIGGQFIRCEPHSAAGNPGIAPGGCAEKMQTVTVVGEGIDPSRKKGNRLGP